METFNDKLNAYFETWMGPRDPRVRGWLLLDSYPPTLALSLAYLLILWLGPRYMRGRKPLSCRGLLVVYNTGLTLLSFYMFYETSVYNPLLFTEEWVNSTTEGLSAGDRPSFVLKSAPTDQQVWACLAQLVAAVRSGGYSFYCQDTHSDQPTDNKIIKVLWWYYFSKLIEFMDTFFFVLRKNNHQITFLHIYHHATMPNIWWFVMNWVPCGHSYFGAALNSLIHVLMYSYYGLSAVPALRPYLWWKKYITQGQLAQFFLTMTQTLCALAWPCSFPRGWVYFQIGYLVTLIILFTNFYIQTYKKQRVSLKNGYPTSTNGHANGTTLTEDSARGKLRVD